MYNNNNIINYNYIEQYYNFYQPKILKNKLY